MKKIPEVSLTKSQLFWHYLPPFYYLIVPAINLQNIIDYFLFQQYVTEPRIPAFLWVSFGFVVLSVVSLIYKHRSLRFVVVDLDLDQDDLYDTARILNDKYYWNIVSLTSHSLVCKTSASLFSWGEYVTVLRKDGLLLFNSISDPDNRLVAGLFGRRSANLKKFRMAAARQAITVTAHQSNKHLQ